MESEIYTFLNNIKSAIEANFENLPVLVENRGDLEFEMNNALKKQGLYVLLRIPEMLNTGNSGNKKISLNIPSLMIQISENVVVNRATQNKFPYVFGQSAQDLAIDLTKFILGKYTKYFTLENISNDYEDGLMISTIYFNSTLVLSI